MAGILGVMTDTPGRLLALLQTPREWPGSTLAERLGVSLRTVRRDVERLRGLGYPVRASMGAMGGYRLEAGTAMPPLVLDDDEAVAIAIGLRTAAAHAVQGIDEASVRALTKLQQVLPSRLRYRVAALSTATAPLIMWSPATVDPSALTVLAAAVANSERVRFGYRTADGTGTTRQVEPYGLVPAGRRWYLVGYDTDRDDWRIFRVDRITGMRAIGARRPRRELPAPDAASFVADRAYALATTYTAVAILHAPAEDVAPRLGDAAADLEPVDAHRCRLRSRTDTLDWLAFRLATLGCEFEVLEPPELVTYLYAMAGRVRRALGSSAN